MSLVVITQPDFFPWLGAIEKIFKAEVFIFLDHVRNRVSDGIYTKRVKLLISGAPKWFTVPLKKNPNEEFTRICDMEVDLESGFEEKHLNTLVFNYKKAPFFKEVFPLIEEFYHSGEKSVAIRNIKFLQNLCEKTNLNIPTLRSSSFALETHSNQLLIDLVKRVNGTSYLYGVGTLNYIDPGLWQKNNITLIPQTYIHPVYEQTNTSEFFAGLSVVDALMNIGFRGVENLIKS